VLLRTRVDAMRLMAPLLLAVAIEIDRSPDFFGRGFNKLSS